MTAKISPDSSAQVAIGRQHQQPARTAARQHHADAEQQPADGGAGQAALAGKLAHVAGVELAGEHQRLGEDDGGGEGEQPHRELGAELRARHLDHRGAQAELRALGEEAEGGTDQQSAQRKAAVFPQPFDELGDRLHALLLCPDVRPVWSSFNNIRM